MADLSGWKRALFTFRPQLEVMLKVEHYISSLHEAVPEGFLSGKEEEEIMGQSTSYNRVRKLVDVLATKDEKAFETFAEVLKDKGQAQLAEKLKKAAEQGPTTSVGTSCQSLTTAEATPPSVSDQESLREDTTPQLAATVQEEALGKLRKRSQLGAKLLRILVVGEQGSGKTTLILNLFGVEVKGSCGELCNYSVAAEGCPLTLYVSYGVDDTDRHLRTIEQLVRDESLSLIIYCLPIRAIRLCHRFFATIKKHSELGVKWDRCLLALTFADALPVPRQQRKLQDFDDGAFFIQKTEDWIREIKHYLHDNGVLTESTFSAIRIRSTTEHFTEPLPNGRDWYAPLWADIVDILLH